MRLRLSLLLVATTALTLAPGPAHAGGIAELVWISSSNPAATGIGTDTLDAAPGDEVALEIRLAATEPHNVYAWFLYLEFDVDGVDELDVATVEEFGVAPTITCTPFPACFFETPTISVLFDFVTIEESTTTEIGRIFTFDAHTLGSGAVESFGSFKVGQVYFTVTENVTDDGLDVAFEDAALASDVPGLVPIVNSLSLNRLAACKDGLDNDRDTLVDFGEDTACLSPEGETEVGDEDGDGVPDDQDNCSLVANPGQVDSDGDACGNRCDGDYNNDGFAGIPDFNLFRLAFGTTTGQPGYDPGIDHNSDGIIGIPDHNFFRLAVGGPAGPSGTTAGTLACP